MSRSKFELESTIVPADRPLLVCLAEWDEAVSVRVCTFEYVDVGGGQWSVERGLEAAGESAYRVYHEMGCSSGSSSVHQLAEVASLLVGYPTSPQHLWGTIGAHPWRWVEPAHIEVVMQAAQEERVFGPFGEMLPRKLPGLAAWLLLCLTDREDEDDLVQRLAAGESLALGAGSMHRAACSPAEEHLHQALAGVIVVAARLYGPGGCPWARIQTHATLTPYLLEEATEATEVLEALGPLSVPAAYEPNMVPQALVQQLKSELGDCLWQVIVHACLAEQESLFTFADILNELAAKMKRRNPHVFGTAQAHTLAEVEEIWQRAKLQEGVM